MSAVIGWIAYIVGVNTVGIVCTIGAFLLWFLLWFFSPFFMTVYRYRKEVAKAIATSIRDSWQRP
jgi:hypothetical protein